MEERPENDRYCKSEFAKRACPCRTFRPGQFDTSRCATCQHSIGFHEFRTDASIASFIYQQMSY